MADDETAPAEPETDPSPETADAHPEPTPVGHGVIQDNVTDPGNHQTIQVQTVVGAVEETAEQGEPTVPAEQEAAPGLHPDDERLPSDSVEPGETA